MSKKKCCHSTPRCKNCPLRKDKKEKKKKGMAAVNGEKPLNFTPGR